MVLSGLLLLWLAASTRWFPVGGMRHLDHGPVRAAREAGRHAAAPGPAGAHGGPDPARRPDAPDALRVCWTCSGLDYITTARAQGRSGSRRSSCGMRSGTPSTP
jgi:hypothetical protein